MSVVRATAVFTPDGVLRDHVVEVDDRDRIVAVRPAAPGDPDPHDGLLIPGLVNAHLHLELSHLGLVGDGPRDSLVPWVSAVMRAREESPADPDAAMAAAAADLVRYGTAAVSDVSNTGRSAGPLAHAGLSGVVQHELIGMDARKLPDLVRRAAEVSGEVLGDHARIVVRPSPHALYSTAPALVRATVLGPRPSMRTPTGTTPDARSRPPASIHVAEDREEIRFLRSGDGAWAMFLDWLKVEWRWWQAPGCSPVELLDQLGVLGPDLLLVHGVHLGPQDRALVARSGAALCLCPRSNLHITGDLPDVPALLQSGVRLCLGTDSLASSPDLDVLGEVAALWEAFPGVPAETWLRMATEGGASALGLDHLGAIAVGKAPGLVLLEGAESAEDVIASRTWLHRPGVA